MERPKTLLCDIDGVLLRHEGDITRQHLVEGELLPGVLDKIREWDVKGYRIILITGRRESTRTCTERQLSSLGILYDQLIMGVGGGTRVVINDFKPSSTVPTAMSINVERNVGIAAVDV